MYTGIPATEHMHYLQCRQTHPSCLTWKAVLQAIACVAGLARATHLAHLAHLPHLVNL